MSQVTTAVQKVLGRTHPHMLTSVSEGKAEQIINCVVTCLTFAKTLNNQSEQIFRRSIDDLVGALDSPSSLALARFLIQEDDTGGADDVLASCVVPERLNYRMKTLWERLGREVYS